jgi:hypothetical protein
MQNVHYAVGTESVHITNVPSRPLTAVAWIRSRVLVDRVDRLFSGYLGLYLQHHFTIVPHSSSS